LPVRILPLTAIFSELLLICACEWTASSSTLYSFSGMISAENNKSFGTLTKGTTDENVYRVTKFVLWKRRIASREAGKILGIFWVSTEHLDKEWFLRQDNALSTVLCPSISGSNKMTFPPRLPYSIH
jgi:hypothetical protein